MNSSSPVTELFSVPKALIGMVHVGALPGTPFASLSMPDIIDQAVKEAKMLVEAGFDAVIIENMHDRPYLPQNVGPEIVAGMSAVLVSVRSAIDKPIGVQILAGANREALAVALAGGASFIRAENFVFAQVADEGLMGQADAGPLLRYRRQIGAEHIRIFADLKKKHASHAITADVDLAQTARAALLFGADAVIVTGPATAQPVSIEDVREAGAAVELPIAIGSGLQPDNIQNLWELADIFIVGSYIKHHGVWYNPPDPDHLEAMMRAVKKLHE
ncbi:MAG: BtpA/SgcQ family protein [Planctomycetota bacterium]|jgi:membrane complex biogenesis BtpA family protein